MSLNYLTGHLVHNRGSVYFVEYVSIFVKEKKENVKKIWKDKTKILLLIMTVLTIT